MDPAEISRRIAYLHTDMALTNAFDVAWLAPEVWDRPAYIEGAGVHYPLGFTSPWLHEGAFMVFACAEVLVGHTEGLSPEQFFDYCAGVRFHLMLHLAQEDRGLRGQALEAAVFAAQRAIVDLDFTTFDTIWKGAIH